MLFLVDYGIKIHSTISVFHSAYLVANSVTECRIEAEKIKLNLPQNKKFNVYIFIEDF
jgi:hypothetical protein